MAAIRFLIASQVLAQNQLHSTHKSLAAD